MVEMSLNVMIGPTYNRKDTRIMFPIKETIIMKKILAAATLGLMLASTSACSSDDDTKASSSSSISSSIDTKSVSVAPDAKPVNLPGSLTIGATGKKLDALMSGTLTSTSLPVPLDIGKAPVGKRKVSIPGITADGTWEKGGFNQNDASNPKSATFSLPSTMWGLRTDDGPVVLSASMEKNKLAATSFNAFASLKNGQVVWVTDGIGKAWQYRIVGAQTMTPKDAHALVTRPAGNKRLEIVLPAGTYDAKTKTYTKRVVVTALSTSKPLSGKKVVSTPTKK